jgi:hypothetical protein
MCCDGSLSTAISLAEPASDVAMFLCFAFLLKALNGCIVLLLRIIALALVPVPSA